MSKFLPYLADIVTEFENELRGKSANTKVLFYLSLLGYPVFLLVWQPVRFVVTLYNSRILLDGQWHRYNRYTAQQGLNSLFYWTIVEHIGRSGIWGVSKCCALGNFELRKWTHVTLLSMIMYRHMSVVLPILSMMLWIFGFTLYIHDDLWGTLWWAVPFVLAIFSGMFFGAMFVFSNYNVAGWSLVPLGLYAVITENYPEASIVWFCISFLSVTCCVFALMISLAAFFTDNMFGAIWCCFPMIIKSLLHFDLIPIEFGKQKNMCVGTLKMIGTIRSGVKYERKNLKRIGFSSIYFAACYAQFIVVAYITGHQAIFLMALGGWIVFWINDCIARFADTQSFHMYFFTVGTAAIFLSPDNLWLCLSYWILVSPIPRLLGISSRGQSVVRPAALRPFNVDPVIDRVKVFLSPVDSGCRVLACYSDPQGSYEASFDGYSTLNEVPLFVSSLRSIHWLPDYWALLEANYPDAPTWWGRTCSEVIDNVREWQADYVVIYQASGTSLEKRWAEAGFDVSTTLDWADLSDALRGEEPWQGPRPKWWLLKPPQQPADTLPQEFPEAGTSVG